LAPKLVSYQCELAMLIESIDADDHCAAKIIRYANKRNVENENLIETVNHAIVFLGLIDTKQFLFIYLLVNSVHEKRATLVQLMVRAKLTADLFQTNGPLNKDLAFVAALLTGRDYLKVTKTETIFMLFKLDTEKRDAIRNLDFGLRKALKQAVIIESKCNPKSPKKQAMPDEFEQMFQDATYWANGLLSSL
jgi:EAL and modified HD-GYP domain-containing signal transduction protein